MVVVIRKTNIITAFYYIFYTSYTAFTFTMECAKGVCKMFSLGHFTVVEVHSRGSSLWWKCLEPTVYPNAGSVQRMVVWEPGRYNTDETTDHG